ncbi:hypothetical protein L917_02768 [Phytophthora nicotianae]|uniref:Uncharacterized protein n=1 Tax=Phytophthora nicotianae TaxID=4792 RepID=W2LT02_PHYNI|nr:hypothetical protein L917_02768 [Phytophthora nicotianae]
MILDLSPGDIAFVGPSHITQLSEFQYVEIVTIAATTATVKHRVVSPSERELWPGLLLAHPVAFPRT